jgi:tRNA pseudouridine55 synthase
MGKRRTEAHVHGILLVDKAPGWTSHDVVARVRRLADQRQVGHTGTLDPMATGLLVVCLGKATRLVEYMSGHDKAYDGEIQLGEATATDDAEGDVVRTARLPVLDDETLRELERRFSGEIMQTPPAFSAVKVRGERAYAAARKGRPVELAARAVRIDRLSLEAISGDRMRVVVECGAGTYVRSLARDIGEALGSAGHLAALRRARVGPFSVGEAWRLEELELLAEAGEFDSAVLAMDEGVSELEAAILASDRGVKVARGEALRVASRGACEAMRIYTTGGEFVGIGRIDGEEMLRGMKVLTL